MKKLWKKCRTGIANDRWDLEIVLSLAGLVCIFMIAAAGYELSRIVWDQPLLAVPLDNTAATLVGTVEILEISGETTTNTGVFALHQISIAIEALVIAGAAACILLIVRDARNKAPFTFSNFRRLRLAGWLMIVGLV